jgi:cell shape-determining protein MreC
MDLARRDMSIEDMRIEVVNRKKMLLDKFKELRSTSSTNQFLKGISDDYEHYFNYIKAQKREQYDALCMLSDYIGNISADTELTEQLLRESKADQKQILSQIRQVKGELDDLIAGTA